MKKVMILAVAFFSWMFVMGTAFASGCGSSESSSGCGSPCVKSSSCAKPKPKVKHYYHKPKQHYHKCAPCKPCEPCKKTLKRKPLPDSYYAPPKRKAVKKSCYKPPKVKCQLPVVKRNPCSLCPPIRDGAEIRMSQTLAYSKGFDAGCRTASTGGMYKNAKLLSYNAYYQLGWQEGFNQCYYNRTHIDDENESNFAFIPY